MWPNNEKSIVSGFHKAFITTFITMYRCFMPQFRELDDATYQKIPSGVRSLLWIFYMEPHKWYEEEEDIGEQPSTITDEVWIYVNGVGTTKKMGREHCETLNQLFGRKVFFCHNPTQSFLVDLLKCAHD